MRVRYLKRLTLNYLGAAFELLERYFLTLLGFLELSCTLNLNLT